VVFSEFFGLLGLRLFIVGVQRQSFDMFKVFMDLGVIEDVNPGAEVTHWSDVELLKAVGLAQNSVGKILEPRLLRLLVKDPLDEA
jgi:hypothetical protein